MSILSWRSCGPFPSTWNLLRSFPNCSWWARPERQNPSPATTYSPLDHTALSTSSTGSSGFMAKVSTTSSRLLLGACRLSSTVTSSISTSPRFSRAKNYNFQLKCPVRRLLQLQHLVSINNKALNLTKWLWIHCNV